MKRKAWWLVVVLVMALAGVGCSEDKNCDSHAYRKCEGGVLYWMDSCDEYDDVIMTCPNGCSADLSWCEGVSPPCQSAQDCPSGQGCLESGTCGACASAGQCRSGEVCAEGLCLVPCTDGPCCDTDSGLFFDTGHVCNSWTERRCNGSGCGADPQQRTVSQACSGVSASCDGRVTEGAWQNIDKCGINQLCHVDDQGGGCQDCDVVCKDGACTDCSDEPCCDNGQLAAEGTVCSTTTEYRCVGADACGADVKSRTVTQACNGWSLGCDGKKSYSEWTLVEDCPDTALCVSAETEAHCQACEQGCSSGACVEPCSAGPCCVDGQLQDSGTVCAQWQEYRCTTDTCGGDAESRSVSQYCSGASSLCDGTIDYGDWTQLSDCPDDALCHADDNGAVCQTCELGCSEQGCNPCTDEPCCDNGQPRDSNFACDAWTEYRCNGLACGADAQQRAVRQYCDGESFFCQGAVVPDAWLTIEVCHSDDICVSDDTSYAECQNCPAGCSNGQCN